MPGRSGPANDTPQSTISHLRRCSRSKAVEGGVHADLPQVRRARKRRARYPPISHFRVIQCQPLSADLSARSANITNIARLRGSKHLEFVASTRRPWASMVSNVPLYRPSGRFTARTEPTGNAWRSHSARIAANPAPRSQRSSTSGTLVRQGRNSRSRVPPAPMTERQVSCRIGEVRGMGRAVDPEAQHGREHTRRGRGGFDEDTGQFRAVAQHIVRPFED